jgi:hypothetical protein
MPYPGAEGGSTSNLGAAMSSLKRSDILGSVVVALLVLGASMLRPAAAEAQARGTLQVTAQVVDIKASSQALQVARATLFGPSTGAGARSDEAVSTLAHVTLAYPTAERSGVLVTIDYSKE